MRFIKERDLFGLGRIPAYLFISGHDKILFNNLNQALKGCI
jgi:hypothetical protein